MNVSRQIGWSQESNLLYQILKQLNKLTSIMFGLKPKYKVYTALLTQTGTDAPVATVLENTLGGEVVWSRVGVGIYSAILANAFTADNTIFPQGIEWTAGLGVVPLTINTFFDHGYQIYRIDSNEINFATYDSSYVSKELSDISNSAKIFIEIRVYN